MGPIDLPAFIEGMIPLAGGVVATVVAIRDGRAKPPASGAVALRRHLRWLGPLLIVFGAWGVSKSFGPFTPTAQSVAANIRRSTRLPLQVDEFTQLDSVDASHQKVTFVSTITRPGAAEAEVTGLVQSLGPAIRKRACADPQYRDVLKEGISIEYAYFHEGKSLPSVVVSPADCP